MNPLGTAIVAVVFFVMGYCLCWLNDAYILPWYHNRQMRRENDRAFKKIIQWYDHDTGEHKNLDAN